MGKMSKVKRPAWISLRQLELLWKFLNSNRDIVSACNKKRQEKEYTHKKWIEITAKLNAVSDGVHKDWKGWSKYWVDFKAKLKRKVASTEHLSDIDTKFLSILGENFGQALPVLVVEPFAQDSNNVLNQAGSEEDSNNVLDPAGSEEDSNNGQPESELYDDSQVYEEAGQSNEEDLYTFNIENAEEILRIQRIE